MSHWSYVIAGWLVTAGALGTYIGVVLARGRALSRRLPPERRRWM